MLMLGLDISVLGLVMMIPVVFLISYGVPGIPGELVLFAGPIATLMNITDPTLPNFLAVYIGIQLGLPDSFRTGSNSTDDYVQAILMNAVYEQRFADSAGSAHPPGLVELQSVDTPSDCSRHIRLTPHVTQSADTFQICDLPSEARKRQWQLSRYPGRLSAVPGSWPNWSPGV